MSLTLCQPLTPSSEKQSLSEETEVDTREYLRQSALGRFLGRFQKTPQARKSSTGGRLKAVNSRYNQA